MGVVAITSIEEYKYIGKGVFHPDDISMEEYLVKILNEYGDLTREEISEITGIPRTTLYENLMKLRLQDKITRYSIPKRTKGRRKIRWHVVDTIGD